MSGPRRVVVVGLGAAGLGVADALRRTGWTGRLTLLGAESETPYDRPPLSKQYLSGAFTADRIGLTTPDRLAALDAEVLLGRSARSLDSAARVVVDSDGRTHAYDELVVATGVRPRTLPCSDLTGVHVLRTLADAAGLRVALRPGRRLVVVGAGFLGLEVAATAAELGLAVTVVEPTLSPLGTRLGSAVAERLLGLHRAHDVQVLVGVGVAELLGDPAPPPAPYAGSSGEPGAARPVRHVRLTDGRTLEADAVLVAIGSLPNTEWLEGSGVPVDDGVVCDDTCRAVPGVWAAGDVARWFHRGVGAHVRLEHRTNAGEQARLVARNLLGAGEAFVPVPFFWTDHYDVRVQCAGALPRDAVVMAAVGDAGSPAFVLTWGEGDRLDGAVAWNAARQLGPYRQQLAAGASRLAAAVA